MRPFFKRNSENAPLPEDVSSVCCLMIGAIGDFMVTTPIITALKKQFPSARLTVIVRTPIAELTARNRYIDASIIYDQKNLLTKLRFILRLATSRFDLWVDLHAPTPNTVCSNRRVFQRNAFLALLPRLRYRLGFAVPWLQPLLTHSVTVPSLELLHTENIARTMMRLMPVHNRVPIHKELCLTQHDRMETADFLNQKGCGSKRLLGFFFGSKQPADTWPTDNIITFCQLLQQAYPADYFLLIGGSVERPVATALSTSFSFILKEPFINTIGTLSLIQTAALLERCAAFITTDAGPMHIADALDIPMVVLFSHKNYRQLWEPLTEKKVLLQHQLPCGPCFSDRCHDENKCMRAITPFEVIQALQQVLAE